MDGMNVSVVIPLYNKCESISKTIDSVLKQSFRDFELLIVDDGSTDTSVSVVEGIIKSGISGADKIRLIKKPNGGVSSARNRGIQEAAYNLVALIDGDDIWNEDCLLELMRMVDDFPEAAMWGVNYASVYKGKLRPCDQGLPKDFRGYVENYFGTEHNDLFCSSSVLLRKDAAIAVGLLDERMRFAEDLDFWYRLILHYPVCFYNKVYAYYILDAENRAEQDINKHFNIYHRWEYYIDKYADEFKRNPVFARYYGMQVAANILRLGYYFGDAEDRKATNHVVQYLPYRYLPFKYRLIFKTPRWLGKIIYQTTLRLKKIKKKL